MKKHVLIIWFLVFTAISIQTQQIDFPKLTGPYLGQKPPGKIAEPFGLEIAGFIEELRKTELREN